MPLTRSVSLGMFAYSQSLDAGVVAGLHTVSVVHHNFGTKLGVDKTGYKISYIAEGSMSQAQRMWRQHAQNASHATSTYRRGIIRFVKKMNPSRDQKTTGKALYPPINIIGLFCMFARSPMSACFSALRFTA